MKWIKIVFLLIFSVVSLNIYAADDDDYHEGASRPIDYDTYGGFNYKQNWIKPKGDWKQLFVGAPPGFDVYLGWRFVPYFGVELGYEWTTNKPKTIIIPNNGSFFGVVNNTGQDLSLTGRLRFKTGHVDLNAFIPFRFDEITPEGIVSLGVAGMKSGIRITTANGTDNSVVGTATDTFTPSFTTIEGRSHAVFRVGLGLQTLVFEKVGVRILWRFENTSVLRARNSTITYSPATRDMFHNSQSLALGLFLKF